ncbi:hypothetical protein [Curtobacterium sp. MCBD17_040]|uniref:phage tail fiber protein n=1 Tax=Curtobacterium sp. MCBD17_040 TaxID=2175674 RepID=UPI000DA81CE2|nr:hypothetical protein [Curtobacterium sp. MCBD17_040]WIB64373.1 hypothetical protein DEI94_04030 [Curtobacterium sp. MCBD17_040]
MALATSAAKDALAAAYAATAAFGALFTTVPGATPGTEVTGGTYARKPLVWSSSVGGVINATATFDVPAGVTVQGAGVFTAATGGSYVDGWSVIAQAFATGGRYTLSVTFSES